MVEIFGENPAEKNISILSCNILMHIRDILHLKNLPHFTKFTNLFQIKPVYGNYGTFIIQYYIMQMVHWQHTSSKFQQLHIAIKLPGQ